MIVSNKTLRFGLSQPETKTANCGVIVDYSFKGKLRSGSKAVQMARKAKADRESGKVTRLP